MKQICWLPIQSAFFYINHNQIGQLKILRPSLIVDNLSRLSQPRIQLVYKPLKFNLDEWGYPMNEKRNIPAGFKLTESEKKRADKIAQVFGHTPGSLASILLRYFLDAYDTHGDSIQFPPRYDFNVTGTSIQKKAQLADEAPNLKAE